MPLRKDLNDDDDDSTPSDLPALRTFIVQRSLVNVINGHQTMVPGELISEEIVAHNISVGEAGALISVELADIGDGKAQMMFRRIFAPGTWFSVTEKTTTPAHLIN